MAPLRHIVETLAGASAAGEAVVLATVVRVIGSSYGGVGTRMVVRVDGTTVGLVSGGCLESDLAGHARRVHRSGKPELVTYDARADDDGVWGFGLGCNGLIEVLLEPLPPAGAARRAALLDCALRGDAPHVLATAIPSGAVALVPGAAAEAGMVTDGEWRPAALQAVRDAAPEAVAAGRRGLWIEAAGSPVALETVSPAVHLVVCGSGPDVVPVVRLGVQLGWDVDVIDHRPPALAAPDRFPGARVLECRDPLLLADAVALTRRSAAVVMSHHFARDADYVHALLRSPVSYIGALGPRARTMRLIAELEARGDAWEVSPGAADCIHGPVGLDLGGDGPEAIALAIVAEVSAVMHRRGARHLRDRIVARDPAERGR